MTSSTKKHTAGTGGSLPVESCQICDSADLESVLFLGYLPPVNTMPKIGERPVEQPAYPAELLRCRKCSLVQLGLVVDPGILFPPTYPYTSGTTRILRENFAELSDEAHGLFSLTPKDLVVDIGSNDGTLLQNFAEAGHKVFGIEPTNAGKLARDKGILTLTSFFDRSAAEKVVAELGRARVVTAANVFAHIEDVHAVVDNVLHMLSDDGLFVTESHYVASLLETVQYDTIYHEHLRYYSLGSLSALLGAHGLEIVHAKKIPTHGGSIRVYSARKGAYPARPSVAAIHDDEKKSLSDAAFEKFRNEVVDSKLGLLGMLRDLKKGGARVYGIGAPSRASTLISYVGLDAGILDCVLEIKGSYKIGKYVPGTLVPVVDEERLFSDKPEVALLLSWHIADELMPKLRARGFHGKFLIPLPSPRLVTE